MTRYAILIASLAIVLFCGCIASENNSVVSIEKQTYNKRDYKLYWLIPDGLRADPDLFKIYEWAREGKLPNIKRMMDNGAYGYTIPVYPGHTPVNFATLFTGMLPEKHGVADGPMRVLGKPLDKVAVGGFNSAAKKEEPIWVTLENAGKSVFLLSIPGSTPPELERGITVRGRWGGWGADFHATNFEDYANGSQQYSQGRTARLFTFGVPLTKYLKSRPTENWSLNEITSFSPPKEALISNYGSDTYIYIYDSTNDSKINYDRIIFSYDKKQILADLVEGEWSGWKPITLSWNISGEIRKINSFVNINLIKIDSDGFFRIRFLYDNINEYIVDPPQVSEEIRKATGPMVDFVDNFPMQLIFYEEDRLTFLKEMHMSLDWHERANDFILKNYKPDILISDTYTPNQMLTSRWWLGAIDPQSSLYDNFSEGERNQAWNELFEMYKKMDNLLGKLLENADENTYVILTSDHGNCALNKYVNINNLFARKGWLKFSLNNITGEPKIDWNNSTVIFLQMDNIYINPNGLAGNYTRASGPAYEKLRKEVIEALQNLTDPETGIKPLAAYATYEDVEKIFNLPQDRVGDITVCNQVGYFWNEEMTEDLEIFKKPIITGYKQAIMPENNTCMWAPFIITGPGIKNNYVITEPIKMQDQYPTIMHLLGLNISSKVDGRIIKEILK